MIDLICTRDSCMKTKQFVQHVSVKSNMFEVQSGSDILKMFQINNFY